MTTTSSARTGEPAIRFGRWLLVATTSLAGSVLAQDVFRAVDANGVVSFSDVASEGAQLITLASTQVREDSFAQQQAMIDQQLAVAQSLEDSRLARAAARTERLLALAAAQPKTVYYQSPAETRYAGGYYSSRHWGNRPGHKPWRPRPPGYPGHLPSHPGLPALPGGGGSRLDPPSRGVPLPPLKSWGN